MPIALALAMMLVDAHAQADPARPFVAPPAPPPPPIVIPKVPVLGETTTPAPLPPPGPDFRARVRRCLAEGAGAGLGPNELSAYSGSCVDR